MGTLAGLARVDENRTEAQKASVLHPGSGARTRPSWCPGQGTWDLRAMSFAPGKGASASTAMLPRLPEVLLCSRARMSSMTRSNHTVVDRAHGVNGEYESRARSAVATVIRHCRLSCCCCHDWECIWGCCRV